MCTKFATTFFCQWAQALEHHALSEQPRILLRAASATEMARHCGIVAPPERTAVPFCPVFAFTGPERRHETEEALQICPQQYAPELKPQGTWPYHSLALSPGPGPAALVSRCYPRSQLQVAGGARVGLVVGAPACRPGQGKGYAVSH